MAHRTIRPLRVEEHDILRTATLDNLNWAEIRFSMSDVIERPEFTHYTQIDAARGDFGLVAERARQTIGVAWAIFLPANDPGYGWVSASTPELSLWVHPDERGHGLGRHLLRLMQSEARDRQLPGLSLSVEAGNYAKRLYEAERFDEVTGRESDGVMLWTPDV